MNNSERPNSEFWSTLPGVLTGIAGVIGSITALILGLKEVGLISQDSTSAPAVSSSSGYTWEFMGFASTGEGVSINAGSIDKLGSSINFEYKIGDEIISAVADCNNNQWHIKDYGWYSPQSEATQKLLNFVCKS